MVVITHNPVVLQAVQLRNMKAAQRRAGGGGVLGICNNSDDDADKEEYILDAAQLKVADALHRLLEKELEDDEAVSADNNAIHINDNGNNQLHNGALVDNGDCDGVSLFKAGPKLCLTTAAHVTAAPSVDDKISLKGHTQAHSAKPRKRTIKDDCSSSDIDDDVGVENQKKQRKESASLKHYLSVVVDAPTLIQHAKIAAQRAKEHIMPVDPGSSEDDIGGKAKQRRKKREADEKQKKKIEEMANMERIEHQDLRKKKKKVDDKIKKEKKKEKSSSHN